MRSQHFGQSDGGQAKMLAEQLLQLTHQSFLARYQFLIQLLLQGAQDHYVDAL